MANIAERRALNFSVLDDAVADAELLVKSEVRTTGNHTLGQILQHLATTNDVATGKKVPPPLPWFMRMLMPLIKGAILNGPVKPGFNLPKKGENYFWPPDDVDIQQALSHLKESVANYNKNGPLPVHPIFGKATREKIDRMVVGHCEMHLSFVHPA